MSEPLLTKRLHISGLTPHIEPGDLERRLSSFGRVKSMDGFGAFDALGDPRKFAFVTMEIGPKDLAKCMNVLSGSTWKGAKLRIGEAKPDFRERLVQFNSKPLRPERPRRTRNPNHGRPSSTLPLTPLSATVAASTPGWVATPSGRIVRPMRMRPERPLGSIRGEHGASNIKGTNSKVKKRVKPPPVRARRRLIDPTKWDSVYLKGVFLDALPFTLPASKDTLKIPAWVDEADEDGSERNCIDNDTMCGVSQHVAPSPPVLSPQDAPLSTSLCMHRPTEVIDIRSERNGALAMLNEMFGDKEDWGARESFDEMEDNVERGMEMDGDDEDGIEIAPSDSGQGERGAAINDKGTFEANVFSNHEDGMFGRVTSDNDVEMEDIGPSAVQVAEPIPPTNLKALFAPKEDASFSLLNHLDLDLDLELDNDILGINAFSDSRQENDLSKVLQIRATTPISRGAVLDPSHPLLFPLLDSLPHPHAHISNLMTAAHRNKSTCFSFPSEIRVRHLRNLPPSAAFTRSPQDTSESIRERWEKDKSALTHEWKRAWREARGSRKGGRAAGGDGGS